MSSENASKIILQDIKIASPCPVAWNDMAKTTEDAKRFCGECRKHVYSIDKLSTEEANALLQTACANNSSVCVRLFKRADGTIITDDCPVGLRRIRDTWRQLKSAIASAMFLFGLLPALGDEQKDSNHKPPQLLGRLSRPKKLGENPKYVAPKATMILGETAIINWRADAYKIATIKKIADQIEGLTNSKNQNSRVQEEIVKLHLAMAKEGIRNSLFMFASQELTTDLPLAKDLPVVTDAEKSTRTNLLIEILTEKLSCLKQLKLSDTEGLQQQLDALQQTK